MLVDNIVRFFNSPDNVGTEQASVQTELFKKRADPFGSIFQIAKWEAFCL